MPWVAPSRNASVWLRFICFPSFWPVFYFLLGDIILRREPGQQPASSHNLSRYTMLFSPCNTRLSQIPPRPGCCGEYLMTSPELPEVGVIPDLYHYFWGMNQSCISPNPLKSTEQFSFRPGINISPQNFPLTYHPCKLSPL